MKRPWGTLTLTEKTKYTDERLISCRNFLDLLRLTTTTTIKFSNCRRNRTIQISSDAWCVVLTVKIYINPESCVCLLHDAPAVMLLHQDIIITGSNSHLNTDVITFASTWSWFKSRSPEIFGSRSSFVYVIWI